ncbi:hypothetical protein BU23DRAFT_63281 [Bimuria novae-zelandiae CBS 107.79]|uniref:Protein kinase domain-containing protein n=1 Tax=Bimuria novae-zelandiae CBS 107.79 TaxID=1447943 RepID=A0A6A5UN82_9PLEO|nr:hypothetical protein BU23DRAFT_63281 [Bimuria novae-zelandiae CBS 107.79]
MCSYRVNISRRNVFPERQELESKFRYEVLFLQSLGQCFFRNGAIVENERTNRRWLRQIHEIIERIRITLSDYSRIAAEEDERYREYSPFVNREMYDTALVEFDLAEELPIPARQTPVHVTTRALRWLGIKAKERVNENLDAWKWALVEKRKFEAVLIVLQDENRRLKDLLPLIPARREARQPGQKVHQDTQDDFDEDSYRLGLNTHAELKRIVQSEASTTVATISANLKPLSDPECGPLVLCSVDNSRHDVVLVEYKYYRVSEDSDEEDKRRTAQRARQLASLLSSAGTGDLATLPFRGLFEEPEYSRHTFVFDFPINTDTSAAPLSLCEMINSRNLDLRLSLPDRFQVAATVAKALAAFHSDGWVHKSFRSSSVVFFREELTKNLMVKNPYLVRFEFSRPQMSHTKLDFDDDPERNLYRHPDRQGEPRASFTRLHDLYALGVVLLEIGLWQTASIMIEEVKVPKGRQKSVQEILKQLTKRRLAHHMGEKYTEAVLSCLDDRYEHRITDIDFSMIFHEEVIRKIDVRALLDTRVE